MAIESTITNSMIKYLNSLPHTIAEKVMGNAFQSNRPDINGCCRGRSFRIEVKSPDHGNKASKGQLLNIKHWKDAGCIAFVCDNLKEVKLRINEERCI